MALLQHTSSMSPSAKTWAVRACVALALAHLVFFPLGYLGHWWIFDEHGRGIPTDFINFWSTGKLALQGHAIQAYDWAIQKDLQVATLGQSYEGNFAWHYPPPFIVIASLLALLPYGFAFALWPVLSFIPFALVLRGLVGGPFGYLLAAAFPVVLVNTLIGQNGFLTAALIGAILYFLPTRPLLAGIFLGLLSYKPQYGLLFPLALLAGGHWRTIAAAAATVVLMAAASALAYGVDAWLAFAHWLPLASQAFLSEGRAYWGKMQSLFALIRFFQGGEQTAWMLQWVLNALVAATIVALWRSRIDHALKAAALATGALLVTPYLFIYDVMVLAVPVALIVRMGLSHGFGAHEAPALALVFVLLAIYPWVIAPTGFIATLIVAVLIGGRVHAALREAASALQATRATT